jgi:hypothetical protein
VQGIQSTSLPILPESFFANNGLGGLNGFRNVVGLRHASQLYQNASGSRHNNAKSFLYPLGALRGHPRLSCKGWRIEQVPFCHFGVQVGVGVDREEEWTLARVGVEQRIPSIPMFDLPLATCCTIINCYCYSKILCLENYSPASDSNISLLSSSALDTIWGWKCTSGSEEWLKIPLDRGGFRLISFASSFEVLGPSGSAPFSLSPPSTPTTSVLSEVSSTSPPSLTPFASIPKIDPYCLT